MSDIPSSLDEAIRLVEGISPERWKKYDIGKGYMAVINSWTVKIYTYSKHPSDEGIQIDYHYCIDIYKGKKEVVDFDEVGGGKICNLWHTIGGLVEAEEEKTRKDHLAELKKALEGK